MQPNNPMYNFKLHQGLGETPYEDNIFASFSENADQSAMSSVDQSVLVVADPGEWLIVNQEGLGLYTMDDFDFQAYYSPADTAAAAYLENVMEARTKPDEGVQDAKVTLHITNPTGSVRTVIPELEPLENGDGFRFANGVGIETNEEVQMVLRVDGKQKDMVEKGVWHEVSVGFESPVKHEVINKTAEPTTMTERISCSYGTHEISLFASKDHAPSEMEMSFWKAGHRAKGGWNWRSRLGNIWSILTKGHAHADMVILDVEEAEKLKDFLESFVNLQTHNVHPDSSWEEGAMERTNTVQEANAIIEDINEALLNKEVEFEAMNARSLKNQSILMDFVAEGLTDTDQTEAIKTLKKNIDDALKVYRE